MVIEISNPAFKCENDEAIFFSRLYQLPGYDGVVGQGTKLFVTLTSQNDKVIPGEIDEICRFWNTTFKIVSQ